MISIKKEMRTHNESTGIWGYTGGKSKTQEVTFDELVQLIEDERRIGIHELLIGDKFKPYADMDYSTEEKMSEDDFDKLNVSMMKAGQLEMARLFPLGDVHMFTASSYTADKISAHYIVNNIYYKSKDEIKHIMKGCDVIKLHFDMQVYDTNHTMRLPLCTKPEQKRPLRYCDVIKFQDGGYVNYPDEDVESDLNCGLITLMSPDDEEMPTPDGYVAKVPRKKIIAKDAILDADKPVKWSDEERAAAQVNLRLIIASHAPHRSGNRNTWMQGIWAIRRCAETYGQVGAYRAIAHEFAKRTDQNNYDEAATDDYYMQPVKEIGVGYTRLKEWADIDTPGWNAATSFDIEAGEEFDIELVKLMIKSVKTFPDFEKFQDSVVEYMNRYYTLIKYGKHPFIIWKTFKVNTEGEREQYLDYKDIKGLTVDFQNKTMSYKLDDKAYSFCPYKCWLAHPNRSEKNRLYFNPKAVLGEKYVDPKAYNLFDGLAISYEACKNAPVLSPDGPYLQHIMKRWCVGDTILYESILNRFALQVQKPWIKHGVALGLMSPDGSGKGLVLQPLFKIIGAKYVALPSSADQVLGKFNALLEGKLIVFLDELTWGGDKEREGALKRLTSELTQGLERKGVDPITIENPSNVIMASNEPWMAPSGKKGRRLEVAKLSPELAGGQTDKTAKIIQDILSVDINSIAKFLYERDITGFNPRKIVTTDALRSQKEESMSQLDKMCLSILNTGRVKIGIEDKFISGACIKKSEFYEAIGSKIKYSIESRFWRDLRELWPSLVFTRPSVGGIKTQWVQFPTIEILRQDFCVAYDDQDWGFEEADEEDNASE